MELTLEMDNGRREIPIDERVNFAGQVLGNTANYLRFENLMFNAMYRLCEDAQKGKAAFWDMYELKDSFYMAPSMEGPVTLNAEGCMRFVDMSPDAAGLTTTIWALAELVNLTQDEDIYDIYENLREYANKHEERNAIFTVLD